jgi:bla regulator protein blaR1
MQFADQLLQALSRTFLHSFWQGLMLSVVAGLIMLFTAKTSSALRYRLLTTAFFLFVGCIGFTFFYEWNAVAAGQDLLRTSTASPAVNSMMQQAWFRVVYDKLSELLKSYSSWIVLIWSAIVLIKSARMTLDLLYISRLRSHRVYSPVEEWKSRLNILAERTGVKKAVTLVESGMIKVPMVLGHLKPVILMPIGVMNNMSEAEIEAILLHELAHIRRHDYLVNFLQRIAECLLFFNPGLLWVSGLIRVERENCCDDMAIERTENRLQFAEALISFKKYSMNPQSYIIGFAGRKNVLLQRMTRIVYRKNTTLTTFESVFFGLNIVLLSMLMISNGKHETQSIAENKTLPVTKQADPIPVRSIMRDKKPVITSERPSVIKTKTAKVKPLPPEPTATSVTEQKQKAFTAQQITVTPESQKEDAYIINQKMHAEQRIQADIIRKEAEKQRELAETNRQIAEKHREEAAAFRKKAEEARAVAEIARREAEVHRQEAEVHRQEAEVQRKDAELRREEAAEIRRRSEESRKQLQMQHVSANVNIQ